MTKNEKFLALLDDYKNAHQALSNFFTDDQEEYHLLVPSHYPFEQSFDDYLPGIKAWVAANRNVLSKPDNYPTLETVSDVVEWFKYLLENGINFHPDNNFADYNNIDVVDAANLNAYMTTAFRICEKVNVDIYGIALDCFNEFFRDTRI